MDEAVFSHPVPAVPGLLRLSSWAQGEVIHRFDVTATVARDASVTVVSDSPHRSGAGDQAGIIRVFPTDYTGSSGCADGFPLFRLDG